MYSHMGLILAAVLLSAVAALAAAGAGWCVAQVLK